MTCIDLMSKRSKQRKTPNAIKLRWICIDLTCKRSKMLSYVANHSKLLNYKSDQNTMTFTDLMSKTSKQLKTTKVIKLRWICIDLTSKTIKNVELRRKPLKTAKLQKWSKYNDLHRFDVKSNHITMNLHRFDVKTIYNVEVSRKTF